MTTLSEPETLALIDDSDRRDAKRLLRVVKGARHSDLSRKDFFRRLLCGGSAWA